MSLFKKNEPVIIDKRKVHEIRKELRPEYERLRTGLVDAQTKINELNEMVKMLREDIYMYVSTVDMLLEKLEQ